MSTPAERMVADQLAPHGVTDERVLRTMASTPREQFLAEGARRFAYEDRALAIGWGQTISQPLVVALMTQAVAPRPTDSALEVGTGSGYQAAVLGQLCARLITLEREPALAERAAAALKHLGIENVDVAVADGSLGWSERAPYDIILVACAADEVPPALLEQLAEGGRLVIPVSAGRDQPQDLRLYTKASGEVSYRSLFPVVFVPLRTG
jgi:protein-L-isoaspartate(D-aspartate) O-methyltransferase